MKTLLTVLLCLIFSAALAQQGRNDSTFNPGDLGLASGFNWVVYSIALQPDGKMVLGGEFTSFNGTPLKYITRLHTNGFLDTTFNTGSGFDGFIHTICLQPDGKIVAQGEFTSFNGIARNGIARLNADGLLDTTFHPGSGFDGLIRTICLQPDGKILVGGKFTSFNGTTRNGIARLKSDGLLDTTFNPGTGVDVIVASIALQPDGKIVVAGRLDSIDGIFQQGVARLNADGSSDTTFNPGARVDTYGYFTSLAMQPDGKIVAAGKFESFSGVPCGDIVRLHADGSLDTTFNFRYLFADFYTISSINSVWVQPDGKIVAAGNYYYISVVYDRGIVIRLNDDGSLDPSLDPGTGFNGPVYSIARQPDGKILAGGFFWIYNQVYKSRLIRLNDNGLADFTFNPGTGFDDYVSSIAIQPDGKIVTGGEFFSYNGLPNVRIARLNPDGSTDTTFNTGSGFNNTVTSIALQPDGKIVAGGLFSSFNNIARNRIARLNTDGSLDTTFNPATDGYYNIYSIAIQPDGKIVWVGSSEPYYSYSHGMIGRLNADGSSDNTFQAGSGFDAYKSTFSFSLATVRSVALQPDGKIIAGGEFNNFHTLARFSIARINANGSPDATFNAGTYYHSSVNSIAVQPDGKILITGYLVFNGTPPRNFIRLNANGSRDAAFVSAIRGATFVALQPDGKILVGGGPGGISRLNTDGSLDTTFNPGTGFNGDVRSLALQQDGKIVAGGGFTYFNGIGRNRITRLLGGVGIIIGDTTLGAVVRVYPNPAEDHVWIELGEEYSDVQVTVRNLAGQLLLTRQVGTARMVELGLGDLPGGMYLLDVSTLTGEHSVHKIVKH